MKQLSQYVTEELAQGECDFNEAEFETALEEFICDMQITETDGEVIESFKKRARSQFSKLKAKAKGAGTTIKNKAKSAASGAKSFVKSLWSDDHV